MTIRLVDQDSGLLGLYDIYTLWGVGGPLFSDDIGEGERELLLSRIDARIFDRALIEQRAWRNPGPDEGRAYYAIRVLSRINRHGSEIDLPTWMLAGAAGA
jgi:hypothetical protein